MICAGIDAGSRAIKVALFDASTNVFINTGIVEQGLDQAGLAGQTFDETLARSGLSRADVGAVVTTGYGRYHTGIDATAVTEITCHARGVHHSLPAARSVIEIGGQDSKSIRLEAGGRVLDFAMNDRCAAGTGRFLEMLAARLRMDLAGLDALSEQSITPAQINSTCVVFAETEIIGLLGEGVSPADIVRGVQESVATRVSTMASGLLIAPVCFTGGVALQKGMVQALQNVLSLEVHVPPQPQFTGAMGAALLAAEQAPRAFLPAGVCR